MNIQITKSGVELGGSKIHVPMQESCLKKGITSLKFPFLTRRNNEDLGDVVRRSHVFLWRHGLLQRHALADGDLPAIVRYATLLYPLAEDAALDMVVDAIAWSDIWRNEYQRLNSEDAQIASSVIWQLVDLTLHRFGIQPADDAPQTVWAFADLWKREAVSMSLYWQQRAATNWRRWFLSFASENLAAKLRSELDLSTHLPDRHNAECAVLRDLIEGSLKYELPRSACESFEVEWLRDIQADSMRWVSDIAAAGIDPLPEGNVVRAVQRQWGLTRDQAIDKVISMHEQLMRRWCELRGHFPKRYATLRLNEEAQIQLQRYVLGIESLMAGHYAWHVRAF